MLVVDDVAMRAVSSVIGMYDITEKKITTVESLGNKRQPLPELDVIYLMEPTRENVDKLLQDWSITKRPMYGNVYLYFLTRVEDAEMGKIKKCPSLTKRLKVRACVRACVVGRCSFMLTSARGSAQILSSV